MESNLPFNIGDIIIDRVNNEIGILLRRYDLFDDDVYSIEERKKYGIIIAWDIYWTGISIWPYERLQTYTEEGLEILTENGVLEHVKNI